MFKIKRKLNAVLIIKFKNKKSQDQNIKIMKQLM